MGPSRNQEGSLEECLGEEGLASVFSVTNWRMLLIGQKHTMFNLHTDNGAGAPQHGLSAKETALITSDHGIMRSLIIKWP